MFNGDFTKEANICTIVSFIISIISYLVEKNLIISICIFLATISFFILYEHNKKQKRFVVIENKRIDILPLINPIKKEDHALEPSNIVHKHIIDDEQVKFVYIYDGVCISKNGEEGIIFNIGAEEYIPFNELKCYAYDLKDDEHTKLIPTLIGDDGLSKKIKIDFLHKLKFGEEFKIKFVFIFPHCLKFGKDYISVQFSYYKKTIDKFVNEMIFKNVAPLYVKVYSINNRQATYMKTLKQKKTGNNEYKYTHIVDNCSGNTSLIYFINRNK